MKRKSRFSYRLDAVTNAVRVSYGEYVAAKKEVARLEKQQEFLIQEILEFTEAVGVVQVVMVETQKNLQYQLGDVVSLALGSVFDDPYSLVIEFVPKRSTVECILEFKRREIVIDPMLSGGGGTVNIGAFSLRVTVLLMHVGGLAPVLLLDEPFSGLKGKLTNELAIQMVKEVSSQLGLQVIMVSDERTPIEDIENGADKLFRVIKTKDVSRVFCEKGEDDNECDD